MTQQGVAEGEITTLLWSGDLTVRRISELKNEVEGALQGAGGVSIKIAPDAVCDLTVLQLLCSAHRTASQQGKMLKIAGTFPESFRKILLLAGFSRHIGCALDVCENCLWMLINQQVVGQEPGPCSH